MLPKPFMNLTFWPKDSTSTFFVCLKPPRVNFSCFLRVRLSDFQRKKADASASALKSSNKNIYAPALPEIQPFYFRISRRPQESFTKISRSPDLSLHVLLHLPRIASSGISQRTGYHSDGDRTGFAPVSLLITITISLVF